MNHVPSSMKTSIPQGDAKVRWSLPAWPVTRMHEKEEKG